VLLTKTLTSSTFRLALIAIGTFGLIASAIFSYVYLSTSSYVRGRSDREIMTEYLSLQGAYGQSGRDGLAALIRQRIGDRSFAGNVYLLVDPLLAPLEHAASARHSTASDRHCAARADSAASRCARTPGLRGLLMGRLCRRQGEIHTVT